MPRLSLCLIARDEAQFIEQCIASVAGVADEVVVCDTGSVDETVALAEAAGARVVHHVWNDDFSAARNVALDAASGDWILLLDADEVLAPGAGEVLRGAIEAGELDCGLLPLHHADSLDAPLLDVVHGSRRHEEATLLARLFRRTPELRWEGTIHEAPSTWLTSPGRTLAIVQANIVHFGNVPDFRLARGKAERNLRLLEQACRDHPEDTGRLTYLARERWRAGDVAGAREAAQAAWDGLLATMGDRPTPFTVTTVTLHVYLLLATRAVAQARRCLERARTWELDHPNLVLLWAATLIEQETCDADELRAALSEVREGALAVAGRVFVDELLPGGTGPMAHRLAGELCARLEDLPGALVHLRAAFEHDRSDAVVRLALAEALLDDRQAAAALRLLEPLLPSNLPDAWLLVSEAAAQLGQRAQVGPMLQRALSSEVSWSGHRRTARLARRLAEQVAWQRLEKLTGGRPPPPHRRPAVARQTAAAALEEAQLGLVMQLLPQVLAADPGDPATWLLFAEAAARQGVMPLADDLRKTARALAEHRPPELAELARQSDAQGSPAAAQTWRRVEAGQL